MGIPSLVCLLFKVTLLYTPYFNKYIFQDCAIDETIIYFNFSSGPRSNFPLRRLELNFTVALFHPIYIKWGASDRNTCKHGCSEECTLYWFSNFHVIRENTFIYLFVQLLNPSPAPRCKELYWIIRSNYITWSSQTPPEWNINSINVNYFPVSIIALPGVGRILIPTLELL